MPAAEVPSSPRSQASSFMSNQFIRRLTFAKSSSTSPEPSLFRPQRRASFGSFALDNGPHGLVCVHSPPNPLVDLIVVHGLNGGSFKTWRKEARDGYFWPGEWLPADPDFQHVRIHTFGYPADWSDFKACNLNVTDFSNSLRGSMIGSPHLTRGEKTPIILVGHSMGGLVIKKACLMFDRAEGAGENPHSADLAERIKCLMFLGTPHHGSDSADRLDRILRATAGTVSSTDYVRDLKRGSLSNQAINEEFKYIADKYALYSFYETRPMPHVGGIIVDKDSACIGGPRHEITQMMEADHRGVCKYENQDDPNYLLIRDHLITIMDDLIENEEEPNPEDLDPLEVYLDCEEIQDETLETILEPKVEGSCQWIERRKDFTPWLESTDKNVWLYWLHGPPGTGKSVTSAHVTSLLQDRDVSHFFFINGNKFHRSVAALLRCIAVQMADNHAEVEKGIRRIERSGTQLKDADEKTIWKKLFTSCILKLPLDETQYWVIDALDECPDHSKLFPLLKAAHPSFPLRIFMTSRTSDEIRNSVQQRSSTSKMKTTLDMITAEDTEADIKLLLKAKEQDIPVDDMDEKADMVTKIARSSHGSFLWANVVLGEMENAHSVEDLGRILEDVPSEMIPHYQKLLDQMSAKNPNKKHLIQALLKWAVCGARPLTLQELQVALKLDIGETMTTMQRTIERLCGQILIVNKHGAVQLIHTTVREFLLDKDITSEYSIRSQEGNCRLARACLTYLSGDEMRPRGRLLTGKLKQSITDRAGPFAEYAATSFSRHLVRGPANNDDIFELLLKFLRSPNVLCWIEYVALKYQSLDHVKEAGANLRRFLERRAKYVAPMGPDFSTVSRWSTDLLRIVSKFGRHILDSPSQTQLLLAPVCPRTSAIYEQFEFKNPDLQVVGLSDDAWADAISYIDHLDAKPTSLASGLHYMTIGHESGMVRVFSSETCAEIVSFSHGEPVTAMAFDNSGLHIVTSGPAAVKLWEVSGDGSQPIEKWSRPLRSPCLSFFFAEDDETLLATTQDTCLLVLPLDAEQDDLKQRVPLSTNDQFDINGLSPVSTSFSPDGSRVAFAYKTGLICLWSLEDDSFQGNCGRDPDSPSREIERIMFNPNRDFEYLVVTYKEGQLALIEYNSKTEVRAIEAHPFSLSSTPDGRTLATGDARGSIQLWDSETLNLLYRINYHSFSVGDLAFSQDGLRLFDRRDVHSVVWEPAALIRNNEEDDDKSTSGTSISYKAVVVPEYDDPIEISALAVHPSRHEAIVGKEDGSVSVYDLKTGARTESLVDMAADCPVSSIAISKNGVIACANTAGKVIVVKRDNGTRNGGDTLQTPDFAGSIQQLMFSTSGSQLLIAGLETTQIWQLSESDTRDQFVELSSLSSPAENCWRFFPCAEDSTKFQLIDKRVDEFVAQEAPQPRSLKKRTTTQDSSWSSSLNNQNLCIRNAITDPDTGYLVVEYEGSKSTRHLVVLEKTPIPVSDPGHLSPPPTMTSPPSAPSDCYRLLLHLAPSQIRMFLGLYKGKAAYLGPHLWVRTVDLKHLTYGAKSVRRKHYFIPHEYIGGNHRVQAVVGAHGEVVFPRRGELAVVLGGDFYFQRQSA